MNSGYDAHHLLYAQCFLVHVVVVVVLSALTLISVRLLTGQQRHSQSNDQQKGGKPLHKW